MVIETSCYWSATCWIKISINAGKVVFENIRNILSKIIILQLNIQSKPCVVSIYHWRLFSQNCNYNEAPILHKMSIHARLNEFTTFIQNIYIILLAETKNSWKPFSNNKSNNDAFYLYIKLITLQSIEIT